MAETMDEHLDVEDDEGVAKQDILPYIPDPYGIRMSSLHQAVQINRAGNVDSVLRDAKKFEDYILNGKTDGN